MVLQDGGVRTSVPLTSKSDPGNMGVAIGILLLSCKRAEIYVKSYPLPVNCRHL